MSKLADAVLSFLQADAENGKTFHTVTDLAVIGHLTESDAQHVIDKLEENGHIVVHTEWINHSFELV